MNIRIITLFPELIHQITSHGVLGQAVEKKLIYIETLNPRQFTQDVHKSVDDRPFGGGDGMIMMVEPLHQAMQSLEKKSLANSAGQSPLKKTRKIYLSPQGKRLTDTLVKELSQEGNIILLCGRYGGVDQRFLNEHEMEEVSIGDYVLSGGELAAGVLIDAVSRFIPGVLGHGQSAQADSFQEGWLEHPHFTRPREWQGQAIPEILLSGNHRLITEWKKKMGQLVTLQKRPDLFWAKNLPVTELSELHDFYLSLNENEKKYLGLNLTNESFQKSQEKKL